MTRYKAVVCTSGMQSTASRVIQVLLSMWQANENKITKDLKPIKRYSNHISCRLQNQTIHTLAEFVIFNVRPLGNFKRLDFRDLF